MGSLFYESYETLAGRLNRNHFLLKMLCHSEVPSPPLCPSAAVLLKYELSTDRYLAPAKYSTVGEEEPTDCNLSSREERHHSVAVFSSGKHLPFLVLEIVLSICRVSESHFSGTKDSLLTLQEAWTPISLKCYAAALIVFSVLAFKLRASQRAD